MQAASDILLGWIRFDGLRRREPRLLRPPAAGRQGLGRSSSWPRRSAIYAELCGRALAAAHARSGDRVAIAGYLGGGDGFDRRDRLVRRALRRPERARLRRAARRRRVGTRRRRGLVLLAPRSPRRARLFGHARPARRTPSFFARSYSSLLRVALRVDAAAQVAFGWSRVWPCRCCLDCGSDGPGSSFGSQWSPTRSATCFTDAHAVRCARASESYCSCAGVERLRVRVAAPSSATAFERPGQVFLLRWHFLPLPSDG